MYSEPEAERAIAIGKFNCAVFDVAESPPNPAVPRPMIVSIVKAGGVCAGHNAAADKILKRRRKLGFIWKRGLLSIVVQRRVSE